MEDPHGRYEGDGEKTLYSRMSEYFQKATFVLEIRHLEEKIWRAGRAFHAEGSKELEQWVEEYRRLLYEGHTKELLLDLKGLKRFPQEQIEINRNGKASRVLSDILNHAFL